MKVQELSKWKIPARTIAEGRWGSGGTNAYRTNRRGAYYYSCSGHGGYVVDARVLTQREKEDIHRYIKPITMKVYTDSVQIYDYLLPYSIKGKRYTVRSGAYWIDFPFYIFEEDCDWAILEYYTDIRLTYRESWDSDKYLKYEEFIKQCFIKHFLSNEVKETAV